MGRIDFVHASVLAWPIPEGRYDLVVTHFLLDCFTPIFGEGESKIGLFFRWPGKLNRLTKVD